MKRIKSMNGYTIMQATDRDESRHGYTSGSYYIFCSSDLRDYGVAYSLPEYDDIDSLAVAEELCLGSNYARAKAIVERETTCATYDEIAKVERKLDSENNRRHDAAMK